MPTLLNAVKTIPSRVLTLAVAVMASTAQAYPSTLSPRDAGARFGQALGAIEICHGSKVTDAGNALRETYTGADREIFEAQAAKVYDAWHKVKNCANGLDPNQCKIIMDKSCLAAEAEIGPSGTVLPGLVEFMKH